MDNSEIIARFNTMWSERQGSVVGTWDLIEKFVVPMRADFYASLNSENEVDWHRREVYDSTAPNAAKALSAAMQANLTSSAQKWFDLQFRNSDLNVNKAASQWLEEVANRIYQALNEANFDIEIAECYLDLVSFGTSILTEEWDEEMEQLVFTAIALRDCLFEEDHMKQVYRVYRLLQWTPVQIVSKFGDKTPQEIKDKANSPQGSVEKVDLVFCIYPRTDKKNVDTTKPMAASARPYGFKYLVKSSGKLLGEEGGYHEMPSFVARWATAAGSRWGKSPSCDALGDILSCNQIKESTFEASGKAIDPANLVEENVLLGNLDLGRGGLTVVTDINGLKPYESGTKFDVANMDIGQLQEQIRDAYLWDQLNLKESPQMTATEVNVRYELMQRTLGQTLARLKNDLLDPLIERTFRILFREGRLPDLPQGVQLGQMDIKYTGPLPRAMQSTTANEITRYLGEVAQLADVYPEALDLVDVDASLREVATLRGVPMKALKDEKEVQAIRKARAKAQQQQMQLEQAQQAGQAAKAAGEGAQAMEAGAGAMQAVGGMGG